MTEDNDLTVKFFGQGFCDYFNRSLLVQPELEVLHKVMEDIHAEQLESEIVIGGHWLHRWQ